MTMELLNRSAVIVKPLRPYLEWAKGDAAEGLAELVFENLRREPHVFLLPEYEDPASQQEVLEEFWPVLFEAMLGRLGDGPGVVAQEPNAADGPGVVRNPNEFDGSGSRRLHASGADLTREP